jgi:hypothetical protein
LDPDFNGNYPLTRPLPVAPLKSSDAVGPAIRAVTEPQELSGKNVNDIIESVGAPLQQHLDLARGYLADLPIPIRNASQDLFGACALVYGLLLDMDEETRAGQLKLVETQAGRALAVELGKLMPHLDSLAPQVRLPLLDITLPALRSLSAAQFKQLKAITAALSAADGRINTFEFMLRHLILRHLEPRFSARSGVPVQIYGIRGVRLECACVLSTLARVGHQSESEASEAFAAGARVLHEPKVDLFFLKPSECGVAALGRSLAKLEETSPQIKRRILAACLECMSHDHVVTAVEVELFRTVADALGCPVPPWLNAGKAN